MNWDQVAADGLSVIHEVTVELRPEVERIARLLATRLSAGGKILLCGNGGSAADAQHMAGELVNRFLIDRRPYAALALSTDTSVLTAVANDGSFEDVFAKQVLALGRPGDVLVAFSTSGNSPNVCRAVEAAQTLENVISVAVAGRPGSRLVQLSTESLCIRSASDTPRIQEAHLLILHTLCQRIEEILEHADP
ncbi:MAG: SIS domain-containing protein [Kiritimatiellia bacterium]|nr:SIS domain-containing protein [Kiritimatiellia bacterium]